MGVYFDSSPEGDEVDAALDVVALGGGLEVDEFGVVEDQEAFLGISWMKNVLLASREGRSLLFFRRSLP